MDLNIGVVLIYTWNRRDGNFSAAGSESMQEMTIKEIAGICNVEKRTVELWAQKCEKISQAYKTKIPAHFTLEETIIIIKPGGRSTLADLLQEGITVYLLHKFMEQLPPLTSADFAEGCSNIFNKSVSNVRNDTITTYADCTPTPWLAGAQDQGI